MKDIKLLALDMDGTSHHKIAGIVQENVTAIKQALDKGVKVVFTTGRPVLAEKNEILENGLTNDECSIVIGCNAGCIYDLKSNKVVQSSPIDSETAKKVFESCEKNNVLLWGYTTDLDTVILSKEVESDVECTFEYKFFNKKFIQFKDVKKDFNFEFFKILAFNGNEELFNFYKNELDLNIATNDNKLAEINKKGINKAFGLKWLSDYFHIPMENIAAIGDGMNDYEMLKVAGVGVAIKNSEELLKQIADVYIDKTNTQGAVKEFIEEYILKEK